MLRAAVKLSSPVLQAKYQHFPLSWRWSHICQMYYLLFPWPEMLRSLAVCALYYCLKTCNAMCNKHSTKDALECKIMLYLNISDTSTSNDWLNSPANQLRRYYSYCMLQHHFLNTVWRPNLQRDWELSLPFYFLRHRMAQSDFLFLDQPELSLSGVLQHFPSGSLSFRKRERSHFG